MTLTVVNGDVIDLIFSDCAIVRYEAGSWSRVILFRTDVLSLGSGDSHAGAARLLTQCCAQRLVAARAQHRDTEQQRRNRVDGRKPVELFHGHSVAQQADEV
jgi:hypothetical protein